jgi:hypothetical protein
MAKGYPIIKKNGKLILAHEVIEKLVEIIESGKCAEILKDFEVVWIVNEGEVDK